LVLLVPGRAIGNRLGNRPEILGGILAPLAECLDGVGYDCQPIFLGAGVKNHSGWDWLCRVDRYRSGRDCHVGDHIVRRIDFSSTVDLTRIDCVGNHRAQSQFIKQDAEKCRQRRSRIVQTLNVPGRVRLGSSLAAALLDGLFEHPAGLVLLGYGMFPS
jgi:hypothetical protein